MLRYSLVGAVLMAATPALAQTITEDEVRAAAAGLKAFGIRPGDKVAIVLPNCPQEHPCPTSSA